jgi:hypothetical protein
MWKWMFRFNALPNLWINVTAPVQAVLFVSLACFIKKLDIALCTMPNTSLNIFGSLAKSNLNG